jgi:hypothetical protein
VTHPDAGGLIACLCGIVRLDGLSDVSGWLPYRVTCRISALADASLFHFLSIFLDFFAFLLRFLVDSCNISAPFVIFSQSLQ